MGIARPIDIAEAQSELDKISGMLRNFLQLEDDPALSKRQQILTAATRMFVAYGYRKTSIDDIARTSGVAKGTVYLYYKNKAELLLHAVVLQKLQHVDELSPMLDPTISPLARLRALIVLSIIKSHELPLVARLIGGDHEMSLVLRDISDDTFARASNMQVDFIAGVIAAASEHSRRAEGNAGNASALSVVWGAHKESAEIFAHRARVLVDLIFAVVNGGRLRERDESLEDYANNLADVIVGGIVP